MYESSEGLGECSGCIQRIEGGMDLCEAHLPLWLEWLRIKDEFVRIRVEESAPPLSKKIISLFKGERE